MTREEAIAFFEDMNECTYGNLEAVEMAISALSENKGDLISRQAVMECFKKWQPYMATRLYEFEKELTAIPSVENKGEWIPVSERLPEMGVRVLCACQADLYDVLKLTPNGWFYDTRHTYMLGFVRAWQPLPEPYKAKRGE